MEITVEMLEAKRRDCAQAVKEHKELADANAGAVQVLDELLAVARAVVPPKADKR